MPLGLGTVLDHIVDLASKAGSDQLFILRDVSNQMGGDGSSLCQRSELARTLGPDEAADMVRTLEPSDRLLVVDARYWPSEGLDFSRLVRDDGFAGATHVVAVGSDADGLVERVHRDTRGRVRGIRRFYHRVTQVEAQGGIVPYSMIPVSAMQDLRFESLTRLRVSMASKGVLSRDIAVQSDVIDFTTQQGLLAFNEAVLEAAVRCDAGPEYSEWSPGVLVGRGARVGESVTITGPVIIQPGATVEDGVRIVGPSLIGARSTLGRSAVIAQALVPQGGEVAAGATVWHCVASETPGASERDEPAWRPTPRFSLSQAPAAWRTPKVAAARPQDVATSRALGLAMKRVADCVLSLIGLLLLTPLLAVVAVLIKLHSRGPVLFIHRREGRGGEPFPCLKFRTMSRDAHRQQRGLYEKNTLDGPQFKLQDDPRVTRFGRLLRTTNIDELPQLINVLLGHMSLVGPRPSPFRENQICVPWRRARLSVRPGITGLWQVCRNRRSSNDFQQWIFYDILYVKRMSPWLDLKILIATVLSAGGKWSVPLSLIMPEEAANNAAPWPTAGLQVAS
jgi:lipopolysaccharide/colanic/teichoic acid biosynthesis glycosyltransferase